MAYSVNWETKVIHIPKSDLDEIGNGQYRLDLEAFHQEIRRLEWAFGEGMSREQVLEYIKPVSAGGVTYARFVLLINDYWVEFEAGQYAVTLVGANTNLQDFTVVNSVSVRPTNSAGLTEACSPDEIAERVWRYERT